MRGVSFWSARIAKTLMFILALWVVGWHHWTVIAGGIVAAWIVNYMMFGSLHDPLLRAIENRLAKRAASADPELEPSAPKRRQRVAKTKSGRASATTAKKDDKDEDRELVSV